VIYNWLLNSFGLPLVGAVTESQFYSLYRSYVKHPRKVYAPEPERQLGQLRSLLKHAYATVPFYRERLDGGGFDPDDLRDLDSLRHIPPLRKPDIIANFPDRITSSRQLFTPWRYRCTSGTIERLTVVQDARKRDVARALQLFSFYSTGGYAPGMKYLEIPPDVCRNVCGGANTVEPNIFRYIADNVRARTLTDPDVVSDLKGLAERQLIYRQKVLTSFDAIGLKRNPLVLDSYLREIDEYRPAILKALPTFLYTLACYILDRGLKPPRITRCILPMGASMTPYMRSVVESAFGCDVHEDYGSAELCSIAAECRHHHGLHPFAEHFHVEVVRQDRPANCGELGRILITDLSNYAMPFIRYDIGDVGVLRDSPCPCGLPGVRLDVQGRHQDCLTSADGTLLTQDQVTDAILASRDVFLFQLEIRDEGTNLHLQVVPRNGHTPDTERICRTLSNLLGETRRITTRVVPYISAEPGGKYRLVKNFSSPVQVLEEHAQHTR
jgi:phenylacetate-CoA ligase